MTEKEYRELDRDSYSSLKVFADDRVKYYRKFVKKDLIEKEDTESIIFGSLVDCLLFNPHEFEERFALSGVNPPTGQMGEFVKMLYKITLENTGSDGSVQRDFKGMLSEAYDRVKYDMDGNIVAFKRKGDTLEAIIEKFLGSDAEIYYKQKRDSFGKYIIEQSTLANAENVVLTLKSCNHTSKIINISNSERYEVHTQFPILFTISNTDFKALIDKLVIDHQEREIFIYDLKTAWDNENEFIQNYLKYRYYLQGAVYYSAVRHWTTTIPELQEYKINYPVFVVAESNNYKLPLVYPMTKRNIKEANNGFTLNGRTYSGVVDLVRELEWHKENGIWNTSWHSYHMNGVRDIPIFSMEEL